jgi:hypothetical protein
MYVAPVLLRLNILIFLPAASAAVGCSCMLFAYARWVLRWAKLGGRTILS